MTNRGNFTDLSIDLETLGTKAGCVITQIGLTAFDAEADDNYNTVSTLIHVDPQSALDFGMHVSWSTIAWWLQQNETARVGMATAKGHRLDNAVNDTTEFVKTNCADRVRVWGNGATFDVTLLEAAYDLIKWPVPWQFRDVRDIRTIYGLKPCANIERPLATVEHDAMADAIAQAKLVQLCIREINK